MCPEILGNTYAIAIRESSGEVIQDELVTCNTLGLVLYCLCVCVVLCLCLCLFCVQGSSLAIATLTRANHIERREFMKRWCVLARTSETNLSAIDVFSGQRTGGILAKQKAAWYARKGLPAGYVGKCYALRIEVKTDAYVGTVRKEEEPEETQYDDTKLTFGQPGGTIEGYQLYHCCACGVDFYDDLRVPTFVEIYCPWCGKTHYTEANR